MIIGISSAIFSSKFNCDDNHFPDPAHRYLIIILIYSSVQLCSDETLLVIIILMIAIIFLFASFQNILIYSLNQFCLHHLDCDHISSSADTDHHLDCDHISYPRPAAPPSCQVVVRPGFAHSLVARHNTKEVVVV